MHPVFMARSKTAVPIWFVTTGSFPKVVARFDKRTRAYIKAAGRPLSAVGIEGRFGYGIGGPSEWVRTSRPAG